MRLDRAGRWISAAVARARDARLGDAVRDAALERTATATDRLAGGPRHGCCGMRDELTPVRRAAIR